MEKQRLLFPFPRGMIICGYKTNQYLKSWGYPHYGIDISTNQGIMQKDHIIRASGYGKVVATGLDTSLGRGVAILYENCVSRNGEVKNLIARYMHMSTIYVSAGQNVSPGDKIAVEGKEGTTDYHLHFELDTDTNYPTYTPQVSAGHSFWKKGIDSTLNPSLWLWQSDKAVTEQYNFSVRSWINENVDTNLPFVPAYTIEYPSEEVGLLKSRIVELEKKLEEEEAFRAQVEAIVDKLVNLFGA